MLETELTNEVNSLLKLVFPDLDVSAVRANLSTEEQSKLEKIVKERDLKVRNGTGPLTAGLDAMQAAGNLLNR